MCCFEFDIETTRICALNKSNKKDNGYICGDKIESALIQTRKTNPVNNNHNNNDKSSL